jgi:hypothetical protein
LGRYKREINKQKIEKWDKQGRCQGTFEDYLSWLTKQDVASDGRCHRLKGNISQRKYELFSDLEKKVFNIFEFATNTINIREQFKLDFEETKRIAEEYNIPHPKDPKTKEFIPMTTDFVITLEKSGEVFDLAIACKYVSDLGSKRTIEKLEIEKLFWEKQNKLWRIMTEMHVNDTFAANIQYVRNVYNIKRTAFLSQLDDEYLREITEILKYDLVGDVCVAEFCRDFDLRFALPKGSSLILVRHLIASHQICCDMEKAMLNFDTIITFYPGEAIRMRDSV